MRSNGFKRICSLWLVFAMVFSLAMPAAATEVQDDPKVTFEQVDNDRVTASLLEEEELAESEPISLYEDTDEVRVSIFLEGASTIEHGYSTYNIAEDEDAMDYRQMLLENQYSVTAVIEETTGEELDVQWNLTLAANAISANVEYGQIDEIAKVDGVKEVVIETQYTPAVLADSEGEYDPQMAISTDMTGMTQVFTNGYTGAGSRIAIIDTGLDMDHQSFDAEAFHYALQQNAEAKEITLKTYVESLDLLDSEEISKYVSNLNIQTKVSGTISEAVYKSQKVPFAFNYIDSSSSYVDHNKDSASDHGSHVAGIAAANRYIKNADGKFVDSLTEYKVVGNAPDAQLMVMKVFGQLGGAFDSDIVAAMEDAIILGADSINMSLGNSTPYFSTHSLYAKVVEAVKTTDTVLVVAAGNEGAWADYANTEAQLGAGQGLLYTEDVQMDRVASPASLTESLSVASVENHGMISSAVFRVIDEKTGEGFVPTYNETIYNNMKPLSSLDTSSDGTGTTYDFVFIDGFGDPNDGELDFIDVKDKIVFFQRGKQVAFSDKANYAVSKGAAATIIYNNVEENSGMDMSAYTYENPAVIIPKSAGDKIRSMAKEQTDADNNIYYTGKLEVIAGVYEAESADDYYVMSSFSNWGTTGDLALKPEITAPGGNIYSVNGSVADTDRYKINSGTSMASPQIAGVVAVVKQYIRESGLAKDYPQFSERQLVQSLMMSTATPLKDGNGNYYSLLQQGVGLVNAAQVIGTGSFIMMDNSCLTDTDSGKVKAEVGDDPDRRGIYEFTFDLYNTTDKDKSFKMYADIFAQDVKEAVSALNSEYTAEYMAKNTTSLSGAAVFSENGASQSDSIIDVPANGSTKVKVRVVLNDSAKAWLNDHYAKGTYVQAYVFAEPIAEEDGAISATHSIAMLGFYGNWTDPSMYDGPSYYKGEVITNYSTPNTTDRTRTPYIENAVEAMMGGGANIPFYGANHVKIAANNNSSVYSFGGNPIVKEKYYPERNALKNGAYISYWQYWLIRGSDSYSWKVENITANQVYKEGSSEDDTVCAFYLPSVGAWLANSTYYAQNPNTLNINYTLPDANEGDVIEISLTHLPEYYGEGKLGENSEPGAGATLKMAAVIDETQPVVSNIVYNEDGTLDITASDLNYIAAVVLYSEDGKKVVSYTGSKEEIEKGASAVYTVDAGAEGDYLLQVFDYANNVATYLISVDNEGMEFNGNLLAYDLDTSTWVNASRHSEKMESITESTRQYTAATAVEDAIYAIAYGTDLYKLSVTDPDSVEFITTLNVSPVDMAYNATDGCIYAVTDDSLLIRIDAKNGNTVTLGHTPVETNTLACDNNGVFYSNRYGSGSVFSYTLDSMKKADVAYDFNGDGVVNDIDVQTLLEYVTGVRGTIHHRTSADLDADGDVDTYDVYCLTDKVPGSVKLITTLGFSSKYMQAMECDPNSGKLYWASYSTEMFGETEIGFSVIYGIDTATGESTRYSDVWDQLSCLLVLDKDAGSIYEPVGGTAGVGGSEDKYFENAPEQAGFASIMGVDNSLKADYLAGVETDEKQSVTVELKSEMKTTNGLYSVSYDPELMSLVSLESSAGFVSKQEKDGVITFGYAGKTAVPGNEAAAVLTFETSSCESAAMITCKEVNNDHPETVMEQKSGAHEWGEWSETASTCQTKGEKTRVCNKCEIVETEALPLDESNHIWDDGVVLSEPQENIPGSKERTCTECGTAKREWIIPEGAELTEAEVTAINSVYVEKHGVMAAQLFEAGIVKAWNMSTIDGSMRYIVELSSDTEYNKEIQVRMSRYSLVTSDIGGSIKPENGNITLNNGIGAMECVSTMQGGASTKFGFYFYIGESETVDSSVFYSKTGDYGSGNQDNYHDYVGVRGVANGTNAIWKAPVIENGVATFEGSIFLDPSTPLDAEIVLEFRGSNYRWSINYDSGTSYLCTDDGMDTSTNLTYKGLKVKLENGKAQVKVYAPETMIEHNERYYIIHIARRGNNAPLLTGASTMSADVMVNQPFTIDLGSIFADSDGDSLTYSVSVDGGEEIPADQEFAYTPETAGATILTFKANDGFTDSEMFTVVLTARNGDVLLGDVNGDGEVDAKDVTTLKRYLADWDGVTIVEDASDVNRDFAVDNKDVAYLSRCLAGWDGYSLD